MFCHYLGGGDLGKLRTLSEAQIISLAQTSVCARVRVMVEMCPPPLSTPVWRFVRQSLSPIRLEAPEYRALLPSSK